MRETLSVFCGMLMLTMVTYAADPFATRVIDYAPAPGQLVNESAFNDPSRALGAPVGGGIYNPDNSKLVSLGGFGGSLTLGFDHTVRDDASNPFGLDVIVFGNAHWIGADPNRHWAEGGVIEISRDDNANGLADDAWYLIPGSHISDPAAQWTTQTWDDDQSDPTYPPTPPPNNPYLDWIPPGASGIWDTSGYLLPAATFNTIIVENVGGAVESIYGYADFSPTLVLGDLDADDVADEPTLTPREFYTVPDDPLTPGMTPGSGGGDAFDIAWAIDAATGAPAGLDGFDFVRITVGVNYVHSFFGEISTEIGGVADVAPGRGDLNCDGVVDTYDIDAFVMALVGEAAYEAAYPDCFHRNADLNGDGVADTYDIDAFVAALTE